MNPRIRHLYNPRAVSFRVYPSSNSRRYVQVFVFRKKKDMLSRWVIEGWGAKLSSFTEAAVSGRRIGRDCVATMVFYKNSLRTSVISHESVHAGQRFVDVVRSWEWDFDQEYYLRRREYRISEERLAYAVGEIARQIVNVCYQIGVFH